MKLLAGRVEIEDLDDFLGTLDGISTAHGCTVQAFDARYIVGREHLRRAVELADRAIERGENVAHDRGVEILLYAAGTRQIDRALTLGVEEGQYDVVVLVDEPDGPGTNPEGRSPAKADPTTAEREARAAVESLLDPETTIGEYDTELVTDWFDIGEAERRVVVGEVPDIVLERVALLDVEK